VKPGKSQQDQWLAEAADALAQAERLTGLLAQVRPRHDLPLAAVQAEIMGLRREIDRLQRERSGDRRHEYHPDWMDFSVWTSAR
jgi:hypothetical protein